MSVIKPPSGNDPTENVRKITESALEKATGVSGADAPAPTGTTGSEGAVGVEPTSAVASSAVGGAEDLAPLDALAADLDAGRVGAGATVDALVERALADVEGSLSPIARAELEATLRSALAHDPTLLQLREGWPEGQG